MTENTDCAAFAKHPRPCTAKRKCLPCLRRDAAQLARYWGLALLPGLEGWLNERVVLTSIVEKLQHRCAAHGRVVRSGVTE